MMTSYSKIRLQVSVLRTNGPLVFYDGTDQFVSDLFKNHITSFLRMPLIKACLDFAFQVKLP